MIPSVKGSQKEPSFLSVSEVAELINRVLSASFPLLSFVGEISEVKTSPQGHVYFTVKDEASQLPAVMWRGAAQRVTFPLKVGLLVQCHGRPTVWNVKGRFQIQVERIAQAGAGALQQKFLELKARLEAEGLFAEERKRELPFLPRAVGIVTSRTGAAIHDMMVKLRERMPSMPVYLYDARVQGDGAADEVAAGVRALNASGLVDVIIVGRGGGSIEDLWAFNEEVLVRAIFASRVPVISGVGHEVDVSLSDLVADVRAPTPTAAAEMVVPRRSDLVERIDALEARFADTERWLGAKSQALDDLWFHLGIRFESSLAQRRLLLQRLDGALRAIEPTQRIAGLRLRIEGLHHKLLSATHAHASRASLRVSEIARRLVSLNPAQRLARAEDVIKNSERRLELSLQSYLRERTQRVAAAGAQLESVSPRGTMRRGYALVRTAKGIARDIADIDVDQTVAVTFYSGVAEAKIEKIMREKTDGKSRNS